MTGRRLWMLVALALVVAACDTDGADTTTTTVVTETTTTTTTLPGRPPLSPNGPAIARQGDRGPYVEALQFYLVCVGLDQPDPDGPTVTVDGSYGPVTAFAVAYYQAQVRRAPSGEPDDETFAMLARECAQGRTLTLPSGGSTTEIAGNAGPGDDEVFTFQGTAGQILRLAAVEGTVDIAVEEADGSTVASGAAVVEADLPGAQAYTVRVSSSVPMSFVLQAEVRSPNVLVSDFGPMALRPDGVGVAQLGMAADNAAAVIGLLLGNPWTDSGWRSDVTACPGTHQVLTWLVQAGAGTDDHPAVLIAFFAEVSDEPIFLQYRYQSLDLDALDPLAQGLATPSGISIGSTFERFVEAYGETALDGEGRATIAEEMTATFAVVGATDSPDPDASRIRSIEAGNGGCEAL